MKFGLEEPKTASYRGNTITLEELEATVDGPRVEITLRGGYEGDTGLSAPMVGVVDNDGNEVSARALLGGLPQTFTTRASNITNTMKLTFGGKTLLNLGNFLANLAGEGEPNLSGEIVEVDKASIRNADTGDYRSVTAELRNTGLAEFEGVISAITIGPAGGKINEVENNVQLDPAGTLTYDFDFQVPSEDQYRIVFGGPVDIGPVEIREAGGGGRDRPTPGSGGGGGRSRDPPGSVPSPSPPEDEPTNGGGGSSDPGGGGDGGSGGESAEPASAEVEAIFPPSETLKTGESGSYVAQVRGENIAGSREVTLRTTVAGVDAGETRDSISSGSNDVLVDFTVPESVGGGDHEICVEIVSGFGNEAFNTTQARRSRGRKHRR